MGEISKRAFGLPGKWIVLFVGICFLAMTLSGCDRTPEPDAITGTTLSVMEDGSIIYYLVEEFDKEYYSVRELNEMIQEEVREYNNRQSGGNTSPVRVDSVELLTASNDKVVVEFVFDSQDSYQEYSGTELFYGTVSQALDTGYRFGSAMLDAKDGITAIEEAKITDSGNRHVLIIGKNYENLRIICPGRVLYISKGATTNSDGTVMASQEEEYTYIITR